MEADGLPIEREGSVPAWTLGDRLRKARENARLKQAELAEQIGIGRSSVVNYETDRAVPSRPVLLAWALRVSRGNRLRSRLPDLRVTGRGPVLRMGGESVTPRIQCCPEDTYDTDAAGELRPTCSCGDGCECICPDCYCWPEDDEI